MYLNFAYCYFLIGRKYNFIYSFFVLQYKALLINGGQGNVIFHHVKCLLGFGDFGEVVFSHWGLCGVSKSHEVFCPLCVEISLLSACAFFSYEVCISVNALTAAVLFKLSVLISKSLNFPYKSPCSFNFWITFSRVKVDVFFQVSENVLAAGFLSLTLSDDDRELLSHSVTFFWTHV